MVDTTNSGPSSKAERKFSKKAPKEKRINRLEAALKEVEAENVKTKATLAAVKAKLESLQRELDRHNAGLHYLAEASEKLRDGLGPKTDT